MTHDARDNTKAAGRARTFARGAAARPLALLLRYAVLGAVALSLLPASAAQLVAFAQDSSASRGKAGSRQPVEQVPPPAAADDASNPGLPPGVSFAPFGEFLKQAVARYDAGEVDLSGAHELRLEADVRDDGELGDPQIYLGRFSNPATVELTTYFVQALTESHLSRAAEGARHLQLVVSFDPSNVTASVTAEMDTPRRAEGAASQLGAVLPLLRLRTEGQPVHVVWNNMKVSASGKQLALRLEMTREQAGNLLLRQVTPD